MSGEQREGSEGGGKTGEWLCFPSSTWKSWVCMPCLEEEHLLHPPHSLHASSMESQLLCIFSKDNKTTGVEFGEALRIVFLDGWTIINLKVV